MPDWVVVVMISPKALSGSKQVRGNARADAVRLDTAYRTPQTFLGHGEEGIDILELHLTSRTLFQLVQKGGDLQRCSRASRLETKFYSNSNSRPLRAPGTAADPTEQICHS